MPTPEFETVGARTSTWWRSRKSHRLIRLFEVSDGRARYRAKHMGGWKKFSMPESTLRSTYYEIMEEDIDASEK